MSEKDDLDEDLNQENSFDSNPSNLPIKVKENKFKNLIEDLKDPMFSWRLREGFKDFTDSVSMSGFGRTVRSAFNSITSSISNFANKIKENAEMKKYNDPTKTGINETIIETQESAIKNAIIMPQAPQPTAKKDPSNVILAQSQMQSQNIINNSKTPKNVSIKSTENSLKLEDMEIDEDVVTKEIIDDTKKEKVENQKQSINSQIEAADINLGAPSKEDKENDFEK